MAAAELIEGVIDELVIRGADDWVHASEVAWLVRGLAQAGSGDAPSAAFRLILQVINRGLMIPGDIKTGSGFVAWHLDAAESLRRIEREWRKLGRDPKAGEVVWLANTEAGERGVLRLHLLAEQADPSDAHEPPFADASWTGCHLQPTRARAFQ